MSTSTPTSAHRSRRHRTARAAVQIAALSAGVAACGGVQVAPGKISSPGEALFNGRTKKDINCYSCHNGDGSGTWKGPDLGNRVPKLTDAEIGEAILDGPGLMPSFKGKATEIEIAQLTAWLRHRFP